MKINILSFAVAILLILDFTTALADQQYEVFEIGESGSLILFETSNDQAKAKNEISRKQKPNGANQSQNELNTSEKYELAESGAIIEFPLIEKKKSTPQVAHEVQNNDQLQSDMQQSTTGKNTVRFEIVEMGDGSTTTFLLPQFSESPSQVSCPDIIGPTTTC